jgi:hypothetical protein
MLCNFHCNLTNICNPCDMMGEASFTDVMKLDDNGKYV